jgi:hypothetical protein
LSLKNKFLNLAHKSLKLIFETGTSKPDETRVTHLNGKRISGNGGQRSKNTSELLAIIIELQSNLSVAQFYIGDLDKLLKGT